MAGVVRAHRPPLADSGGCGRASVGDRDSTAAVTRAYFRLAFTAGKGLPRGGFTRPSQPGAHGRLFFAQAGSRHVGSRTETGLRGVYLQMSDLRSCTEEATAQHSVTAGWTLNRVAKMLFPEQPLKDVVLRKWMRAGLLRAASGRPSSGASQTRRSPASERRTAWPKKLAGSSTSVAPRSLAGSTGRRVPPVYGKRTHRTAGASLFRRADLSRLLDRTAA